MLANIDLTNAFATEVAVIASSGDIEYANKKWNDTAEEGGLDLTRPWNYLDECRAAADRGCREAERSGYGIATGPGWRLRTCSSPPTPVRFTTGIIGTK